MWELPESERCGTEHSLLKRLEARIYGTREIAQFNWSVWHRAFTPKTVWPPAIFVELTEERCTRVESQTNLLVKKLYDRNCTVTANIARLSKTSQHAMLQSVVSSPASAAVYGHSAPGLGYSAAATPPEVLAGAHIGQ